MPDGEDWVMRPVMRGMCRFESLKDCTLTLGDLKMMNDALDVQDENEARYQEAQREN